MMLLTVAVAHGQFHKRGSYHLRTISLLPLADILVHTRSSLNHATMFWLAKEL